MSGVNSILNLLLYHNILHFQFIAIENFQFRQKKDLPKCINYTPQSQRDPTVPLRMSFARSWNPIRGLFLTDSWPHLFHNWLLTSAWVRAASDEPPDSEDAVHHECVCQWPFNTFFRPTDQTATCVYTYNNSIVCSPKSIILEKQLHMHAAESEVVIVRSTKKSERIKTVGPISRCVWSKTINNPGVVRLCFSTASDSHSAPQKAWTSDLWHRGHSFITSSYAERRSELQVTSHCLGLRNELFQRELFSIMCGNSLVWQCGSHWNICDSIFACTSSV